MKKIIETILIIVVIITIIVVNYTIKEEQPKELVTLVKCIDGDTALINYNNEEVKLRFLAINTKEIGEKEEPYGKEASEYTCNKLKNAKNITIELDNESDKYDKYERLLAWVFVDDNLLQIDLVENGYAEIKYVYGNYKYISELEKKEKYAKENKLGIWGL